MKLAILDCVVPDALVAKYGPTGDVVAAWLRQGLPEAEMARIDLPAGEPPPAPGAFDGVVISGSEKGVYDETPWMGPLRRFLEEARGALPVFGICFGHQIMADVWGGKAEKLDIGFQTGARAFEIGGRRAMAHVAHQDQVTRVPPGARVVASAPYCPVGGLAYDFPALSVQFHPECREHFVEDLIDMFGEELMTEEEIAEAKATLTGEVAPDLYVAETAAFFRAHA